MPDEHAIEESEKDDDAGQVLPLVVVLLVVAAASAWLIGEVAEVVVDRARARTAADAAALGAAVYLADGPDRSRQVAMDLARRNGGVLMAFHTGSGSVEVTVRVGRARATAKARARPVAGGAGP